MTGIIAFVIKKTVALFSALSINDGGDTLLINDGGDELEL